MNEELKKNIETEIQMLKEISIYTKRMENASDYERNIFAGAINSLVSGIKIINSSISRILEEGASLKKIQRDKTKRNLEPLENVQYSGTSSTFEVVLDKKNKEKFLKELTISEKYISQIKKADSYDERDKLTEFTVSRGYVKMANKFFLEDANKLIKKEYFKSVELNLKKANFDILLSSYIATMLFTMLLSFFAGIFLIIFFVFFDFSLSFPFFSIYQGNILPRLLKLLILPILLAAVSLAGFYIYPSSEKNSISGRINQELPFAVIHMSAISGSGIAPAEIFKIIGLGKEYPYLKREIRKVLNQINLYGYDLVTALVNASKTSPNEQLAELFSGIATTITSGADLQDFFEKRAETLLMNYRIERERYTKVVETFLDIYISLVIAAPMVFLLLLILMVISGIEIGLNSVQLSVVSVFGIAILNLFFLIFLQLKQPPY